MADQNDILKNDSRPSAVGIGERLQAARIEQGLSIEDIASRMHLSVQIVKSIEENNFDDITAPIFVKGYLRAYARIVSLDEEELIQEYANYYSHEDPPIAATSNMAPELSVADVRIKWMTYLVIVGLAVLLAAWWWNKNQDETTPISLDSQGSGDSVVKLQPAGGGERAGEPTTDGADSRTLAATAPADVAAAGQPAVPSAQTTAADEPAQTGVPPAPVVEPTVPQPLEPPPAPAEEIAEPESAPMPGVTAAAADTADSDMPAAPEAEAATATQPEPERIRLRAPVLVAPSGADKLSLTVTADTWADIKDGNDFRMVYHLLSAGQELELTGSAPFSVFLGNGPGVEILFNGEPIEFSARIRSDNTARLKIGG